MVVFYLPTRLPSTLYPPPSSLLSPLPTLGSLSSSSLTLSNVLLS